MQMSSEKSNLAQTGGENHDFVDLSHLEQEVVYAGTLDNINIMDLRFDLDWHNVVGRRDPLKDATLAPSPDVILLIES